MKSLELTYFGMDSWDRPLYKDADGNLYVDVDPRKHVPPSICTKRPGEPDGEPCDNVLGMKFKFIPRRATW